MKNKLLLIALSLTLLTNSVNVYAQTTKESSDTQLCIDDSFVTLLKTNPDLIYQEYENVIDIQEIELSDNQINKSVEALEYTSDGNIKELEYTVTLNKIVYKNDTDTFRLSDDNATSNYYVLSAETTLTESTDSLEQDGVTLYGVIAWYDNFGLGNEFDHVSGHRLGAVTGDGYYAAQRSSGILCSGYFGGTGFYSRSDLDDTSGSSFRLLVRTTASNGSIVKLEFTTSIFD